MSRVDNLPEVELAESIAQLRKDMGEIKNRQRVGGNNLVLHYSQTANTWDVDEIVLSSVLLAQWRVTFTPSTVINRPFAQLSFDFDINSGNDESNNIIGYTDPDFIDDTAVRFLIDYVNPNLVDVTMKLKFGIKSVDTGTITWVRLS